MWFWNKKVEKPKRKQLVIKEGDENQYSLLIREFLKDNELWYFNDWSGGRKVSFFTLSEYMETTIFGLDFNIEDPTKSVFDVRDGIENGIESYNKLRNREREIENGDIW